MTEYVNGFLFDCERTCVALVLKQKGHWSAIGGKRESGESWAEALSRDFQERAGVLVPSEDWEHTITLLGPEGPGGWELRFFRAFSSKVYQVKSMGAETVKIVSLVRVGHLGVVQSQRSTADLDWTVPLTLSDHIAFPVLLEEKRKVVFSP